MPETMLLDIVGTTPDGEPIARPVEWNGGEAPRIVMAAERKGQPALAPGDRVLARLKPIARGGYEGRTLKRVPGHSGRILGQFRRSHRDGGRIVPTDRRSKAEWRVADTDAAGAEPGELVLAEPLPHAGLGLKPARIIQRLGGANDARAVSLLAIHSHGIPDGFDDETLAEADRARGVGPDGREDLRALPLVTIDGADARDFDDAVFAEPDGQGWRLVVAIADVAHYVRAGSALDRTAEARGNSVYFPDRVVPMLPEALSSGWCSLKPEQDRGCLFAELRIDASGRKTGHRFGRGLMRSAARLTYEEVQAARDAGRGAGVTEERIAALYGAFRALLAARQARGTLDLDLPERKVLLDDAGKVTSVVPRARLDSHRLIEEFMVLANVAAAEELERFSTPCMYRVHDRPSESKLEGLRSFLHQFGISLPPQNVLHPRDLDGVLQRVAGTNAAPIVNEVVLRAMAQAAYAPDNLGHFGLALPRYAHFTSPIRRYADLLVHRALVRALRLGPDGLTPEAAARFEPVGTHITSTERRAAAAERDAVDRYLAAFMADRVGEQFDARISGVTRFGLFVTLPDSGAGGLIPVSSLPDDFWFHDAAQHRLTGRHTRLSYALADAVRVRLTEAAPLTGGLLFQVADAPDARPARKSGRRR